VPKFEEAYYLEKENWEVASFRQLSDANERAILREKDLRDQINGNLVLGIRNHPATPHFYISKNMSHMIVNMEMLKLYNKDFSDNELNESRKFLDKLEEERVKV